MGFHRQGGQKVTPCKYDFVSDYHEGFAKVVLDRKDGYVDKNGREIMPFADFKSYNLGEIHDGMAWVKIGDKYGYLGIVV